jgi:phenylpyruvate tautomerase PptA (4-oxalocrotonate tautomerase family)
MMSALSPKGIPVGELADAASLAEMISEYVYITVAEWRPEDWYAAWEPSSTAAPIG